MSEQHPTDPASALTAQQGFLRRLALGLVRDEASAEDLVQDTYTLALRHGEDRPSRAWLATVMRRLALSNYRSRKRREKREETGARSERIESHVESIDRRIDMQALLAERLKALPVEQSRALALRYGEDLSPTEIAERLGEPLATVKARLRRGLARLRADMDTRHGGERSVWAGALLLAGEPGVQTLAWPLAAGLKVAAVVLAVAGATGWVMNQRGGAQVDAQESAQLGFVEEEEEDPDALEVAVRSEDPLTWRREIGVEQQPPDVPLEPQLGIDVQGLANLDHEPFLAMQFGRRATGAFLRLRFVGEEDSILAGEVHFNAEGVPQRDVELRGLSNPRERTIELRVPAFAEVRVTAEIDGMLTEPLTVQVAGEEQWVEAEMLLAPDPNGVHLVLALTGNVPPDGTRMWLELYPEEGELQMDLRSPVIEDGRLVVGGMTAGKTRILGMPYGAVSGRERQCLVFSIEAQLAAGERAELSAPMEMSGVVLVDFDGVDLDWSPRTVQIERADGTRHTVQCQRLGMKVLRGGVERTITVIPRIAPGAITIHFDEADYLPLQHAMTVLAAKTHQVQLLFEAR